MRPVLQLTPRQFSLSQSSCVLPLLILLLVASRAEANAGAKIYQQLCASCHGMSGEGVQDRYDGPLFGDESLAELTELIAETMPKDHADLCVGDEASAVASYIFEEFYSYDARIRKGLVSRPRVELSRLTVAQFRNSVADLVAHFTAVPRDRRPPGFVPRSRRGADTRRDGGLFGTYFQSELMNKRDRLALMRLDSRIDFDFDDGSPDREIDPEAFSITWYGSIDVRQTGYYDFRITSPNGIRLYLNTDSHNPRGRLRDDDSVTMRSRLIDGWVSSGEQRTLSGRVFLLGGRSYPLRLEYFKYQDPTASILLEWKPPHGVWSTMDKQSLRSKPAPRTFVVDTPFPPDDHSLGYERGSAVSTEWQTAIGNAALATADEIISRLPNLTDVERDSEQAADAYGKFANKLASLAFRRPLTDQERQLFGEQLFQDASPELAVRRAVLLILTSPHFLYTDLTPAEQPPTQHTIAARLAFVLWDSLPDKKLREAADSGQLESADQIAEQAQRMVKDPRTRAKLRSFFEHWLELEHRDLAKDQQLYPEFDEAVIADLRTSLELFVERVVWGKSSDYRELLQADYLLLSKRLQQLYGQGKAKRHKDDRSDHPFERVSYTKQSRSGILTHPYLLSAFAYHNNTSPIHRGVFLTRNIVGRSLKPPPVAVAFENSDFSPELTMREKVTQLTRDQACKSCHDVINPLGFALENYDAVGRWRSEENDKPIDSTTDYTSAEGTTVTISSPRDIAAFAVESSAAQRAFVRQIFQHLAKQDPSGYGAETVDQLRDVFVADEFHIRKLLAHVASRVATHSLTEE